MKRWMPIVALATLVVVVLLVRLTPKRRSNPAPVEEQPMTLEQKLEILAGCGFRLAEPLTADDLAKLWDRAHYEKPGYDSVLSALGTTEEQEPWRNHCVNLWAFDTECIEDHGAYRKIAERMAEMAGGSLPLENVQDYVDVDNKKAWLSFSFRGRDIKITCKVEDDWVDPTVFGHFAELLAESDPSQIYVLRELGGQEVLLGCVTREELARLNRQGIRFVPLT